MSMYPGRDRDLVGVANGKFQCRFHTQMPCGTNVSAIATKPSPERSDKAAWSSYQKKVKSHISSCSVCKSKGIK